MCVNHVNRGTEENQVPSLAPFTYICGMPPQPSRLGRHSECSESTALHWCTGACTLYTEQGQTHTVQSHTHNTHTYSTYIRMYVRIYDRIHKLLKVISSASITMLAGRVTIIACIRTFVLWLCMYVHALKICVPTKLTLHINSYSQLLVGQERVPNY